MQLYMIGEIARRAGVAASTIRYYEQMGLVSPAHRSEGNQRRYEKADLERLNPHLKKGR